MDFNWKKQLLIGGIATMLTLGLAGCGNGGNEDTEQQQQNQPNENNGVNEDHTFDDEEIDDKLEHKNDPTEQN